jgi:hypothetical protein
MISIDEGEDIIEEMKVDGTNKKSEVGLKKA